MQQNTTTTSAPRKVRNCDKNPIVGGPAMKPAYPIPVTLAIPAPGAIPFTRPADPNTSGMMIEKPHPATPNPGIAQAASGMAKAHPSPAAAPTEPPGTDVGARSEAEQAHLVR